MLVADRLGEGGAFAATCAARLTCAHAQIRVLTNTFPDAYGYPLRDEMKTGRAGTLPTPPAQ